ncbi:MAG TPA: serine hydrolase domain-containing protein [Chloroflexota bacterium]|nr:serine hydrolase domain-containing protein [Chloroflexota bacterium]
MSGLSSAVVSRAFNAAWKVLEEAVAQENLPSAVLTVANAQEIICQASVGGIRSTVTVSGDSLFLIASITKPIFATTVLRLVERGALLLHEPVVNHWPEFAVNNKQSVTLWHLLTHTSGLDQGASLRLRGQLPTNFEDLPALDAVAARDTFLNFAPGTAYSYCNVGFRVMAVLIERLTKQTYQDYLQTEVLDPIGMVDTTFSPTPAQRQRTVSAFDLPYDLAAFETAAMPSGGLWSTAGDLVRFGQTYLNGGRRGSRQVLNPNTVAAATRIQYTGVDSTKVLRPNTVYRGLGFQLVGPDCSELVPVGCYGHGGASGTRLLIDPGNQLVLVFLTNRWGQDNRWRDRAINAFYGSLAEEE